VTARRICDAICDTIALTAELVNINSISSPAAFSRLLVDRQVDLILGVHAYRAGRFLVKCGVPFIIILGGTDVNVDLHNPEKRPTIERSIGEAGAVVAFSDEMKTALANEISAASSKTFIVPQAVTIGIAYTDADSAPPVDRHVEGKELDPDGQSADIEALALRNLLNLDPDATLLLLPAGLRAVKDVLFAIRAVAAHADRLQRVCLRIVGPELDPKYAASVRAEVAKASAATGKPRLVQFVGPLPRSHLHLAMALPATIVLNTSVSEGMCNSIMEAMLLGRPVLCRRNAGNSSLVKHGIDGLLFDTQDEMMTLVESVRRDEGLARRLGVAARTKILANYGLAAEMCCYNEAVRYVLMKQGEDRAKDPGTPGSIDEAVAVGSSAAL